ncbi:SubName: Full=Uncharacterized protein {ECO:0000313/EMBL:CCA74779.1} [Serendipita indica DSM 11827]|nr:SubName: Full=Uncharacterized protein {ECO:0000313/EMBL:CCA74779.1} [Serendipita indica DSM 11827]
MPRQKSIAYRLAPKFATVLLDSAGWTTRRKPSAQPLDKSRQASPTDASAKPGWSYGSGSRSSLGSRSASRLSVVEGGTYDSDHHTVPPSTDDEGRLSRYRSVGGGGASTSSLVASDTDNENDKRKGKRRQRPVDEGRFGEEEEDDSPGLVVLSLSDDEVQGAPVRSVGHPPRKRHATGKKKARPSRFVPQIDIGPSETLLPVGLVPKKRPRYLARTHYANKVSETKHIENPLAMDSQGYVDPIEAYKRLLQPPNLHVQRFDGLFVPLSDKAVVEVTNGIVQNVTCCIRRCVPTVGRPVWGQLGSPCGTVVRTWDSYRRHVICVHLGCGRPGKKETLQQSIQARLSAAQPSARRKRKRVDSDEDSSVDSGCEPLGAEEEEED